MQIDIPMYTLRGIIRSLEHALESEKTAAYYARVNEKAPDPESPVRIASLQQQVESLRGSLVQVVFRMDLPAQMDKEDAAALQDAADQPGRRLSMVEAAGGSTIIVWEGPECATADDLAEAVSLMDFPRPPDNITCPPAVGPCPLDAPADKQGLQAVWVLRDGDLVLSTHRSEAGARSAMEGHQRWDVENHVRRRYDIHEDVVHP